MRDLYMKNGQVCATKQQMAQVNARWLLEGLWFAFLEGEKLENTEKALVRFRRTNYYKKIFLLFCRDLSWSIVLLHKVLLMTCLTYGNKFCELKIVMYVFNRSQNTCLLWTRVAGSTLFIIFFQDVPTVIVGNNCDLADQRMITTDQGEALAVRFGNCGMYVAWLFCSQYSSIFGSLSKK